MSRTRVKFNALKDTELTTADTETSAKGVITFTDKRIRVGLGGDKKIDYMPATPDNVVTLDNAQTIPSEKTFTDTLLYSSSRTIADKSNTEVVVKKDVVEHLDGYVTKDTAEVITGNKTFNGNLLKESSITSLNDLSDNEVPNKQQLLNKLSEYVEKSGFTAPINFIGEIADFSNLPSDATKGDCYYTNQPPEKKGFWLKSDTGWLNLGTGVEINLDGFANVNTPNEFTKATVFNTSIEVKDNSGSILKADTNAVVVNKPLKVLSVQVNPNALEFVTKEWFEKSAQTIQGLKTFNTPPKLLSPATNAQHAVNKTYVDTMVNAMSMSKGNNVVKNRPPTTNDTRYRNGVLWVNVGENPEIYIRTANSWYGIHSETVINCPPSSSGPSFFPMPEPSEPGFGGGLASDKALLRLGLEKLSGTEDPTSIEYANYVHTATGSIMHFTPVMYHKLSFEPGPPYYGLKVEFSNEKKEGFVLNRSFINGGQIVEGVFMDKFINSIKNGKNVSVKDGIPASLNDYQPISQLGVSNTFGGCIDAAKKRGGTFLTPKWVRDYYILLMFAKYQACYMAGTLYDDIAWCSTTPHVVRGCNNGALSDEHDNTIKYAATGDGRGGKTGGVRTELDLKKISILGDGASPVDFNGVVYEAMFGLNGNGGKLGMLKNGVDIQGLTSQNAFTTDYYDFFTLPFSGAGFYGNGSEQVLECATEQDTDAWRRDCLLIPKAKYGSSADIFGGDSVTLAAPNQCMPYVGALWSATDAFGAFFANLSTSARNNYGSSYISGNGYGFRACALGEVLR